MRASRVESLRYDVQHIRCSRVVLMRGACVWCASVRDPCIWLFRFMQYGVMLAIRTLPPGLSEPVVKRFTDMLVKARGGLPAA